MSAVSVSGNSAHREMKKAAAWIEGEECDVETSERMENKTVTLIKK